MWSETVSDDVMAVRFEMPNAQVGDVQTLCINGQSQGCLFEIMADSFILYEMSVQSRHDRLHTCDHCAERELSPQLFKLCMACRTRRYCSPACQKSDWKRHKTECTHLREEPNMQLAGRILNMMYRSTNAAVIQMVSLLENFAVRATGSCMVVQVSPDLAPLKTTALEDRFISTVTTYWVSGGTVDAGADMNVRSEPLNSLLEHMSNDAGFHVGVQVGDRCLMYRALAPSPIPALSVERFCSLNSFQPQQLRARFVVWRARFWDALRELTVETVSTFEVETVVEEEVTREPSRTRPQLFAYLCATEVVLTGQLPHGVDEAVWEQVMFRLERRHPKRDSSARVFRHLQAGMRHLQPIDRSATMMNAVLLYAEASKALPEFKMSNTDMLYLRSYFPVFFP